MGAEPYEYFVPYEPDLTAALAKLRQVVFESGEFNRAELNPPTPETALEAAEEEGTRSILDVLEIAEEPGFCSAAPFSSAELRGYFGSERPTRDQVKQMEDIWEAIDRGMAHYIIVYEGDAPKEIYFAGYSFD